MKGGETGSGDIICWHLLRGHVGIGSAAELNPAAVVYKLPDKIPWGPVSAGSAKRRRCWRPAKPGFYMVYNRYHGTKGNHFGRAAFPSQRPLYRGK